MARRCIGDRHRLPLLAVDGTDLAWFGVFDPALYGWQGPVGET